MATVTLPAGELLQAKPGSILTLDEAEGNEVEILGGQQVLARGEIVTVGDQLAVRIVQIMGPDADREG